ncbi:MAG: hypothetical protein IT208_02165 [Chthonomonadales bacterium]|nr:hypothetical protein [Chthonomonadales bacterium]
MGTGEGVPPTGPGPESRARVRFDAINEGWALLQQQMGTWVLTTLITIIIVAVVAAIVRRIPVLNGLIIAIPEYLLLAGMARMALRQIDGGPIAVGDLFDTGDVVGHIVVAAILIAIGTTIGFVLCILPGIVVGGLWMFTIPLIVDRRLAGVDAMRESWNTLRGEVVMSALFWFVMFLLVLVGVVLCGVGVLLAAPLVVLSVCRLYRDFFPRTMASATDPPVPGVPPVS